MTGFPESLSNPSCLSPGRKIIDGRFSWGSQATSMQMLTCNPTPDVRHLYPNSQDLHQHAVKDCEERMLDQSNLELEETQHLQNAIPKMKRVLFGEHSSVVILHHGKDLSMSCCSAGRPITCQTQERCSTQFLQYFFGWTIAWTVGQSQQLFSCLGARRTLRGLGSEVSSLVSLSAKEKRERTREKEQERKNKRGKTRERERQRENKRERERTRDKKRERENNRGRERERTRKRERERGCLAAAAPRRLISKITCVSRLFRPLGSLWGLGQACRCQSFSPHVVLMPSPPPPPPLPHRFCPRRPPHHLSPSLFSPPPLSFFAPFYALPECSPVTSALNPHPSNLHVASV